MALKISGLANVSYLDFVKCYDSYWMAKFLAANTRVESAKVDWTANPAYMLIPPVQTVNYLLNASGLGTFEYITQDMKNVKSALNPWKVFRKDVLLNKWRRLHRFRDFSVYREMIQMDKDKQIYLKMTEEKFREVEAHNDREMANLSAVVKILMATAYTGAVMFAAGVVIVTFPGAAAFAAGAGAEPAAVLQLVAGTRQVLLLYAVSRGALTTAVDWGNPGAVTCDLAPPVAHIGPEMAAHTLHKALEEAEEVVEHLKGETEETAHQLYEVFMRKPLPAGMPAQARFASGAAKLKNFASGAEKFSKAMLVVSAGFELIHGYQEMRTEFSGGRE